MPLIELQIFIYKLIVCRLTRTPSVSSKDRRGRVMAQRRKNAGFSAAGTRCPWCPASVIVLMNGLLRNSTTGFGEG